MEHKTDIRDAQIAEALLRMIKLDLHENVIRDFKNEGKLNKSETNMGILYWLDETEEKMVREWEEKTGGVVYHVIKTPTEFGLCYSLLYVSPYTEEWKMDNDDLNDGCPFAYVINIDAPTCSEYGCIGVKPRFGGLVRTA